MRISIDGDALVVTRFGRTMARFTPEQVEIVRVLSHKSAYPPAALKWIYRIVPALRIRPCLQAVFVLARTSDIVLVYWDRGFQEAVDWLRTNGWAMDEAIERSLERTLVRQDVHRARA